MNTKMRLLFSLGMFLVWAVNAQASVDNETVSEELRRLIGEAGNSHIFILPDDYPRARVSDFANRVAKEYSGDLRFVYEAVIKGFSMTIARETAEKIAQFESDIVYVEENAIAWLSDQPAHTGMDPQNPAQGRKSMYPGLAQMPSGAHAWIIDTGVNEDNARFNVEVGVDLVGGAAVPDTNSKDTHGHGTRIAKRISKVSEDRMIVLHPIRVLGRSGAGAYDAILAGIDFVARHADMPRGDIVNMNIASTQSSKALSQALVNASNLGMRVVVTSDELNEVADDGLPKQLLNIDVNLLFTGATNEDFVPVSSQ